MGGGVGGRRQWRVGGRSGARGRWRGVRMAFGIRRGSLSRERVEDGQEQFHVVIAGIEGGDTQVDGVLKQPVGLKIWSCKIKRPQKPVNTAYSHFMKHLRESDLEVLVNRDVKHGRRVDFRSRVKTGSSRNGGRRTTQFNADRHRIHDRQLSL